MYHSFKEYGYKGPKNVNPCKLSYYPDKWRRMRYRDSKKIDMIVKRLRQQAQNRPQYRAVSKNLVELGIS